jgi:hypothetical protein
MLAISLWMMYTLRIYVLNDFNIILFLLQADGGWPILAGTFSIFFLWMLEVKLVKNWWKRWLVHMGIFAAIGVPLYFWWNHLVVETLVTNLENLHLRDMTIEQALKLVVLCAVLFVPSLALSGGFRISKNPVRAQLYQFVIWLALCVGLAYPINLYWWLIAFPIQPLADWSIIPYAGSYHEAVKLVAGANSVRFFLIAWGTRR